ncbi:MAG TPA: sugar-transfer associated ATP-grasp domain-containing protein [Bacillota bacterium]|nr:sugar-transfer associated ATP-grasp domain-containing protein [Bacillota bacterium]HPZ21723.1 sugar-transfer associated ATP-grasp domain-containing protein [Bacillota bacterium]HQD19231.1 sugar-transfer associated ATP-grasp domain-containing protein [Bacillota bacterium]
MKKIARVLKKIVPTKKAGFKSPLRQSLEMLWLGVFYRLSPIEYRSFEFGKKGIGQREIRSYIRVYDAEKKLRRTLNSRAWAPMLTNKLLFNSYFSQRQIPVAKLYGMFHPQFGSDIEGNSLRTKEDLNRLISEKGIDQFVVKPLAGKTGVSVLVLELVEKTPGDYVFEDRGGERYDLDRLVKHMSRKVEFGQQGFIMEARIVNHPDIAKLNPSSVNTCRLVTFMNFEGEVSIILSVIRIGVKGKNTDNWHTGGLAAAIDPVTGILGEGLIRPDFPNGGWHSSHPDTGAAIKGVQVPHWDQIVDLVLKAARMTPFIRTIGWDVASTPDGPVIIEANFSWGPMMCQACNKGLLTPELRQEFAKFGLRFPS